MVKFESCNTSCNFSCFIWCTFLRLDISILHLRLERRVHVVGESMFAGELEMENYPGAVMTSGSFTLMWATD